MRKISIEQAPVWAYCEQLVHAAVPQGMRVEASQGYSPGLSEGRFLADKIDAGVVTGFAEHADTYAIHRAVIDLVPAIIHRSQEEIEMLFARRLLKNDFDAMDHRSTGDASRPIGVVEVQRRQLVQEHAMRASRPDPCRDPVVINEKGRRVYTDKLGRIMQHPSRFGFSMINMVGDDPLEVISVRRKYTIWRQALVELRICTKLTFQSLTLTDEIPPSP